MAEAELAMWTIYDQPSDFPPGLFVAREYVVRREQDGRATSGPTPRAIFSRDLAWLRARMEDMGLVSLDRSPTDDPIVIETWL